MRLYSLVGAAILVIAAPAVASAQTVRAQTVTVGKSHNFRRSDFSVEAQRRIVQGVSVWGWDVLPVLPGKTDVHIGARYHTDFGIRDEDLGDPFLELDRSRFLFDLAYLRYRPFEPVTLTVGRQWVPSALGIRDIDGARARLQADLGKGIEAHSDLFIGADVASRWTTTSPDTWDTQGLPLEADLRTAGTRYGGALGIGWEDASAEVAWQRSHRSSDDGLVTGDERLGAALRGNLSRRVVLSSSASYHALLEDIDRATLELAWRAPWASAVLSGGVEHRQPWFDSASIFNVFGARPFEEARLVYQHPVAAISTSVETRVWGRAYDANLILSDLGGGETDSRALGAAIGHDTRFRAFGLPFEWRTFGSVQASPDRGQGGEQWLGDVRFRFPAIRDKLFLSGRFLGLAYVTGVTASQPGSGTAATGALVAEAPVSFGEFTVSVDGTKGSSLDPTLRTWISFETDLWL